MPGGTRPHLRVAILGLAVLLPLPASSGAEAIPADPRERAAREFVPGELIVRFAEAAGTAAPGALSGGFGATPGLVDGAGLDALCDRYRVSDLRPVFRSRAPVRAPGRAASAGVGTAPERASVFLARLGEGVDVLEAAARFADHPEVVYAEPNFLFRTAATPLPSLPFVPDDRFVSQDGISWSEGTWGQDFLDLYGIERTRAVEGWNLFDADGNGAFEGGESRPGEGIVIAVIDTGMDSSHPDIADNLWTNPGEIAGNGIDDDGNGFVDDVVGWDFRNGDASPDDDNGHGSHVAGTAAARGDNAIGVIGIAPWSRVMALKAFDAEGTGTSADIANAVLYAADMGADVLSNSYSGFLASQLVEDAFAQAHAAGALAVAAAGNADTDMENRAPAGYDTVVAVAAIDHQDRRASFSNFGSDVDLSAPGVDVLSLNANGGANPIALARPQQSVETDYLWISGTSMACPHVSGAAAVLMSFFPGDSADEIWGRLLAGARPIAAANPGFDGRLGIGAVDLMGSLAAAPRPVIRIVDTVAALFPGQETPLLLELRNFWLDAPGITATLTTANPFVTVLDDSADFGDLPIGGSRNNAGDPFRVSVAVDAPFSERVDFELRLRGAGGYAETLAISVDVTFFRDVLSSTRLPRFDVFPFHIAMRDYDADGATDVSFIGFDGGDLYRNLGDGSFESVGQQAGAVYGVELKSVFADLDRDRDVDLHIQGPPADQNQILSNNGDGTFGDVTQASGLADLDGMAVIPLDYDLDGWIDLLAAHQSLQLTRNQGDGTFADATAGSGLESWRGVGVGAIGQLLSFDYDDDRDPDVLLLQFGLPSRLGLLLFRNEGEGSFRDVTAQSGLDTGGRESGWGAAAGDYDNDGDLDLFLTGLGQLTDPQRNALFRNQGDGTFTDVIDGAGDLAEGGVSGVPRGCAFFDYDNDGDLDLHLTNEGFQALPTNALYRNNGDGTFSLVTELAFPAGFAPSGAYAAIGDYNADGALDVYAPRGVIGTGGRGGFFENRIGLENHWLRVDLLGTASNREGYGARVVVEAGGIRQLREVHDGSVETLPLHFGLGQASSIDAIEVYWPSGRVQRREGADVDRILVLDEGEAAIPVAIDVRPRSDRNLVWPWRGSRIAVALLGSPEFDVTHVDPRTLRLGPDSAPTAGRREPVLIDADGDGRADLVARFQTGETGLAPDDVEVCLHGETVDGVPFAGCDAVRVLGVPRWFADYLDD